MRPTRRFAQKHMQLAFAALATAFAICGMPLTAHASDTWTKGTKKILIIPVRFTDLGGPSNTPGPGGYLSDWASVVDGTTTTALTDFYEAQSYGQTHLQFTVLPEINLGVSYTAYNANYPGTIYSKYSLWYEPNSFADDARAKAREVGIALGTPALYDTDNYDLDIIACGFIPGQGTGSSGQPYTKGVFAQNFKVLAHELGHNFGLHHANGYSRASLYSPVKSGTFFSDPYADVYCTMGFKITGGIPPAPDRDFNAFSKFKLGWLAPEYVNSCTTSGTYRVHAFDAGSVEPGKEYAIRITKDPLRNYWFDYRQAITGQDAIWSANGLLVHFGGESIVASADQTTLIDTTPGSRGPGVTTPFYSTMHDAPLAIGRTFSDTELGMHVTPVAKGGTTPESLDVVVNFGDFVGNTAPTVAISPTSQAVTAGVPQAFTVVASDPDGDALAYNWEFDDVDVPGGTVSGGTNPDARLDTAGSHTWTTNGTYFVRCTVTDMKGHTTTDSSTITVTGGAPGPLTISGVIKDELGNPIAGAIVNNYKISAPAVTYGAANFAGSSITSADGKYIIPLPAIGPNTYNLTALYKGYGFTCTSAGGAVAVGASSIANVDFTRIRATRTVSGAVVVAGRGYDPATDGPLMVSDGTQSVAATAGSWTMNIPDGATRTFTATPSNGTYSVLTTFQNPYTVVDDFNLLHYSVTIPGKMPETQFVTSSGGSDDTVGTVDIPIMMTPPAGDTTWPADQGVFCWVDDASTAEYGVDYIAGGGYKTFRAGTVPVAQTIPLRIIQDGVPKIKTIIFRLGASNSITNLGATTTYTYTITNPAACVAEWDLME
jgi:hypothetical protein